MACVSVCVLYDLFGGVFTILIECLLIILYHCRFLKRRGISALRLFGFGGQLLWCHICASRTQPLQLHVIINHSEGIELLFLIIQQGITIR